MSTPRILVEGALLSLSAQELYVVPSAKIVVIQAGTACNHISTNSGVDIWLLGSGGAPSDATRVRDQGSKVTGYGTEVLTSCNGHVLEAGGSIWARGENASAVSIRISGEEFDA